MPKYDYKRLAETGWFVFVAVAVFALEVLVKFDPDAIQNWQTWAIGIGGGMVRAAAGALLAVLTKPE